MRTTNLRTLAGLLGGSAALALALGGCPPPEGGGGFPGTGGSDPSSGGTGGSPGGFGGAGGGTGGGSGGGTAGSPGNAGSGGGTAGSGGGGAGNGGTGGRGGMGGGGAGMGGGAGGRGGTGGNATAPDAGRGGAGGGTGGGGGGAGGSPGAIMPIPPLPPKRMGYTVVHSTNVSMWEIHDPAVYQRYKPAFDEIIGLLENGYFGIERRLGTGHKLPIRVIIDKGGCCGGWAGGGDVGYNDGDFMDAGAIQWTRGVVIGEVVNGVTGAVASEWPRDWWADTAWYFPGFIAADVLKELNPAAGMKWEIDEKYPTYPTYVLFKAMQMEKGWEVYQKLFQLVKTDKMAWDRIGANPSAIKTNYTIAYISLAYGANLGERFKTAGRVTAADPAVIQAIMDARAKLAAAGPNAPGWAAFRAGNYMAAGN